MLVLKEFAETVDGRLISDHDDKRPDDPKGQGSHTRCDTIMVQVRSGNTGHNHNRNSAAGFGVFGKAGATALSCETVRGGSVYGPCPPSTQSGISRGSNSALDENPRLPLGSRTRKAFQHSFVEPNPDQLGIQKRRWSKNVNSLGRQW